jgi:hypothetical protein
MSEMAKANAEAATRYHRLSVCRKVVWILFRGGERGFVMTKRNLRPMSKW